MRAVRDKLIAPTYEASIQDIEKALGCSRRTAERIYAGESVGTEPHFAALTHPEHGAAYLETVLRNVAPERRAKLSEELMFRSALPREERRCHSSQLLNNGKGSDVREPQPLHTLPQGAIRRGL
jgi:hypothetical protein